jgi:hypothetical protein
LPLLPSSSLAFLQPTRTVPAPRPHPSRLINHCSGVSARNRGARGGCRRSRQGAPKGAKTGALPERRAGIARRSGAGRYGARLLSFAVGHSRRGGRGPTASASRGGEVPAGTARRRPAVAINDPAVAAGARRRAPHEAEVASIPCRAMHGMECWEPTPSDEQDGLPADGPHPTDWPAWLCLISGHLLAAGFASKRLRFSGTFRRRRRRDKRRRNKRRRRKRGGGEKTQIRFFCIFIVPRS